VKDGYGMKWDGMRWDGMRWWWMRLVYWDRILLSEGRFKKI
jgi:hypothetical protein